MHTARNVMPPETGNSYRHYFYSFAVPIHTHLVTRLRMDIVYFHSPYRFYDEVIRHSDNFAYTCLLQKQQQHFFNGENST